MLKFLLAVIILTIFGCTPNQEIEIKRLHNQLVLSDQHNVVVVQNLENKVKLRGERNEEVALVMEVENLLKLRSELGLKITKNQVKTNIATKSLRIYLDTLASSFQQFDYDDKNGGLITEVENQLKLLRVEKPNRVTQYRIFLLIVKLETRIISYYNEMVGVNVIEESFTNGSKEIDTLATGLNFAAQTDYAKAKLNAKKLQQNLGEKYRLLDDSLRKEVFLDSALLLFTDYLLNGLIPFWYGTEWEFDGSTAIPNKGTIACGYFVSTTLKQMGVEVNMYKLAQQNPENEAKSVAIEDFYFKSYDYLGVKSEIFTELKSYEDGLYFAGLDYHVGYLYIKKEQSYFIHSNYIDGYVMVELIENSEAFISETYFISNISGNRAFGLKWLFNEEVEVIKD